MSALPLRPSLRHLLRLLRFLLPPLLLWALLAGGAQAQVRIKDIADIEGVRDNQLVGYGLVVGLNATGDRLRTAAFTRQSLIGMLERLGVATRDYERDMETRNVAAVMVTASLSAFARQGSRIDVNVSTLGDAQSLQGGTLLVTPLLGADGEIHAVAQGAVAVSGFAARGQGQTVTRGVPTAGRIANGAIVERELPFRLAERDTLRLALRNPDFTTARRIAEAINRGTGAGTAQALDPGTVRVRMPAGRNGDIVALITEIEQLRVQPDQIARVVIDEHAGIIVMGENVRISTVAIAQGNLTIRVTEAPQVSQPAPFGRGQTTIVPRTEIEVEDGRERRMTVLGGTVSLRDLVAALNALGVGPRDMISILQAIKAAGALQAEIEVM